ncbi:MAG: YtxH domain-containing protein [Saprospiraceae bacterium]
MKASSKVLVGVGLGILAGGVAGYFLASEEGQEFQKKTKEQLKRLEGDMKVSLEKNKNIASEKLSETTEKAKSWADDISQTVKNKLNKTADIAEETVDDVQEDFQSGIDRAKRTIRSKAEAINNGYDNGMA